jgi:ketosteroid isomerase-like protein
LRSLRDNSAISAVSAIDQSKEETMHDIIAMERAALDRWGKGDPGGYLEITAPDASYFDPIQDKRIDGLGALRAMLEPFVGKITVDRYDMIDPRVQEYGDAALLTFNLISYRDESPISSWNSSEMYARVGGQWRIVHSHWSYIKPELKGGVSEVA